MTPRSPQKLTAPKWSCEEAGQHAPCPFFKNKGGDCRANVLFLVGQVYNFLIYLCLPRTVGTIFICSPTLFYKSHTHYLYCPTPAFSVAAPISLSHLLNLKRERYINRGVEEDRGSPTVFFVVKITVPHFFRPDQQKVWDFRAGTIPGGSMTYVRIVPGSTVPQFFFSLIIFFGAADGC